MSLISVCEPHPAGAQPEWSICWADQQEPLGWQWWRMTESSSEGKHPLNPRGSRDKCSPPIPKEEVLLLLQLFEHTHLVRNSISKVPSWFIMIIRRDNWRRLGVGKPFVALPSWRFPKELEREREPLIGLCWEEWNWFLIEDLGACGDDE